MPRHSVSRVGPNSTYRGFIMVGALRASMRDAKIPESVKHPLSLQADYANPQLWGGAAILVGILGIAFAGVAAFIIGPISGLAFAGLGGALLAVGLWMYRRAA